MSAASSPPGSPARSPSVGRSPLSPMHWASALAAASPQVRSEMVLAVGMLGLLGVMILPLPALVLDVLLALSVSLALVMFLFSMHIEKPLQFSAFPSLLLVTTLGRLALNVASTRLILGKGPEGAGAAGAVIQAFGQFVVGGNTAVGIVVFLILVIVNFVVITKGAGRIAEVAARFTLDGMPGKQMAIDADLAAGLIDDKQARARRSNLEQESDFYGAMDGASKFVRGDAIAGLIITFVNILGGLGIGTLQYGMSVYEAAGTFTRLTVGDGLVSQIPALLTSIAAGLVTTRAATGGALGKTAADQLFSSRRTLALSAGVLGTLALVPGMPHIAFGALAAGLGALAYRMRDDGTEPAAEEASAPIEDERAQLEATLPVELLEIEVGYELVALVDSQRDGSLLKRISGVRKQLAQELGVLVPPIHMCDNLRLRPGAYRISLSGNEIGQGELRASKLLVMDPTGDGFEIPGEDTIEPAFGLAARWIESTERERAEMLGYTVVDAATVAATHLGELLARHAPELVGRQEVQQLLDLHGRENGKVIEELIPNLLSVTQLIKVLHNLLKERVSIRDFRTILEALADSAGDIKDPDQLTEIVRQRLGRQLAFKHSNTQGVLTALVLAPEVENTFRRLQGGASGLLDPGEIQGLVHTFERATRLITLAEDVPVLLTAADIRRSVATFAQRNLTGTAVLSYRELDPAIEIKTIGVIGSERNALEQGAM